VRYTVTWDENVQNDLASLWIQAPDRRALSSAADEIDRLLRLSPLSVGEPFGADRRLAIEPLEAVYTVSPDDCLVRVHQVVLLE
jgi:hypothetical protein